MARSLSCKTFKLKTQREYGQIDRTLLRFSLSYFAMTKLLVFFALIFGVRGAWAQEILPETPSLDELLPRVVAIEAQVEKGGAPANPKNAALWRFKIERARLLFDKMHDFGGTPWQNTSQIATALATIEQIGKAAGEVMTRPSAGTLERAYFAADGSPQPYWIYLPANYSPAKQWPLVVLLHGYDPQMTKADAWLPGAEAMRTATERGFIVAVPYGRRNTDFLGVGEDDVLAVRDEMLRHFKIDENRTFLLGPSMGGYGVWAVGLKHPHLWAGLSAMAARSDTWLWLGIKPEDVAPWKLPLYLADDPRFLAPNALNLPVFFQHGELDHLVPVEHSRLLLSDWKKLGLAARYREIPEGDHYIYWLAGSYEQAFEWMRPLRRQLAPRRVVYKTASLKNNRAYWVSVEAFEDYSKPARIEAEIVEGQIRVKLENVARFVLSIPASLRREKMTLLVDGVETAVDANAPIQWNSNEYPPSLRGAPGIRPYSAPVGLKSPLRPGTIREALRGPMLLVWGDENDQAAAARFNTQWREYADGILPQKNARDVSVEDRANFNLILFGTRASNSLLAELGDLPLEKTNYGYRIGTEAKFAKDIGLIFCFPSPFDARRMVVVHSGEGWGAELPLNHRFDLQPDYLVFTQGIDAQDKTNIALEAGYFDNAWQLRK